MSPTGIEPVYPLNRRVLLPISYEKFMQWMGLYEPILLCARQVFYQLNYHEPDIYLFCDLLIK